MGIDVKGVVDGVDGAPPEVPLTEGERTPVHDARHIRVPSQGDLRQSKVLGGKGRRNFY